MKEIKKRLKNLENNSVYRKSVVIFIYHGLYDNKLIYLVTVQNSKFICNTKEAVNSLLQKVSLKYDIEVIITDNWEDISENLKDCKYTIWR